MTRFTILALATAVSLACSTTQAQITFGPDFVADYNYVSIGTPPGVPGSLGGLTLLPSDPNTLLIGGSANNASGTVYAIGVVRGVDNHITGFAPGPATVYSTAPNIDGGLTFGPGGVLFYSGYPTHQIGQIEPGSVTPDRVDPVSGITSSIGSLAFVPPGFAGAGQLKVVSFNSGQFGTVTLTPDGSGTYAPSAATLDTTITGGPEGIAYVDGANAGFTADSMLVAEYNAGRVGVYEVDGSGNPIPSTRRDFITGLSGAEGAFIDPLTGDFLFSTFGGGNQVIVVGGFVVPEPATAALLALVSAGAVLPSRRRR